MVESDFIDGHGDSSRFSMLPPESQPCSVKLDVFEGLDASLLSKSLDDSDSIDGHGGTCRFSRLPPERQYWSVWVEMVEGPDTG